MQSQQHERPHVPSLPAQSRLVASCLRTCVSVAAGLHRTFTMHADLEREVHNPTSRVSLFVAHFIFKHLQSLHHHGCAVFIHFTNYYIL